LAPFDTPLFPVALGLACCDPLFGFLTRSIRLFARSSALRCISRTRLYYSFSSRSLVLQHYSSTLGRLHCSQKPAAGQQSYARSYTAKDRLFVAILCPIICQCAIFGNHRALLAAALAFRVLFLVTFISTYTHPAYNDYAFIVGA
jgi:hypothetical protein